MSVSVLDYGLVFHSQCIPYYEDRARVEEKIWQIIFVSLLTKSL